MRADDGGGGGQRLWNVLWDDLDGSPLRGKPWEYRAALTETSVVRSALHESAAGFRALAGSNDFYALKGDTAAALTNVSQSIDEQFFLIEPLFTNLEAVFQRHVDKLDELDGAAWDALTRANTRWDTRQQRRQERDDARSVLTTLQHQLDTLRDGDGTPEQIDLKQADVDHQAGVVHTAEGRYDDADTVFQSSRSDYFSIRAQENVQVGKTAKALEDFDVGDLEDPNWLEDLGGWAADFFGGIAENLWNAVKALANGNFGDFLHYLSKALNDILLVIAAIAAVVLVVLLTIGTGGALLGLLGTAMLWIGGAKLLIDTMLAASQAPDPETGLPKTWGDIALDVVVMLVGGGIGKLMVRGLAPGALSRLLARTGGRPYSSRAAAATIRRNQRIIDAAAAGRGMGSRANGNRLTARQVRERAIGAERYNNAARAAQDRYQQRIDDLLEGLENGTDGYTELGGEQVKQQVNAALDAIRNGTDYVRGLGDPAPGTLPPNGLLLAGACR